MIPERDKAVNSYKVHFKTCIPHKTLWLIRSVTRNPFRLMTINGKVANTIKWCPVNEKHLHFQIIPWIKGLLHSDGKLTLRWTLPSEQTSITFTCNYSLLGDSTYARWRRQTHKYNESGVLRINFPLLYD